MDADGIEGLNWADICISGKYRKAIRGVKNNAQRPFHLMGQLFNQ